MNEKDMKVLSFMRKNSREALSSISRKTGIPISTLHDTIKGRLDGYVDKFTAMLNYNHMGYNARAMVMIKANRNHKEEFKKFLETHPNVNSLFKINNGYDYIIDCVFKDLIDLEEFFEKIEMKFDIEKKEVFYIVGKIKEEEFMSEPKMVEMG